MQSFYLRNGKPLDAIQISTCVWDPVGSGTCAEHRIPDFWAYVSGREYCSVQCLGATYFSLS